MKTPAPYVGEYAAIKLHYDGNRLEEATLKLKHGKFQDCLDTNLVITDKWRENPHLANSIAQGIDSHIRETVTFARNDLRIEISKLLQIER